MVTIPSALFQGSLLLGTISRFALGEEALHAQEVGPHSSWPAICLDVDVYATSASVFGVGMDVGVGMGVGVWWG